MVDMLKRKFSIVIYLILISVIFLPPVKAKVELNEDLFYELMKIENNKPEIKIPEYKKIKLDNGLIAYLVKDSDFPIVEVTGFIKGGRRQENLDIAGISDIMVKMMSNGTKNLSEEEYARQKEIHGIDINFGINNDTFDFRANALSSQINNLLSLLADSLKNPNFEATYFRRILQEQNQYLAQATVQPNQLLNSYFFKNIYNNHPYSFANNIKLKKSNLRTYNPNKLREFYNDSISPEKMIIAIVGDINIKNTKNILEDNFADWKKKDIDIKNTEVEEMTYNINEVIIVDKQDSDQAHMKIGHNFPGYDFKRDTAFLIGNRIFGQGGFSSRLMEEIRTKKGYAYSIYSNTSYNKNGGVYYISTKVDAEKAPKVINAVKEEMRAIKTAKKEITEEEVTENINLYNGLLPSNYKYLVSIMNGYIYETVLLGEKNDYLNSFIEEYNSLTDSEVQRVMADKLQPDKLLTVVVGNSKKLKPVFEDAGYEVRIITNR